MERASNKVLALDGVSVCVGSAKRQQNVLRRVSFEIFDGEAVAICGHNGSGKSTLLGVLSGLITPTEGHLITSSSCPLGATRPLRSQLRLASVAQSNSLDEKLSVADNLHLSGSLYGLKRQLIRERALHLLGVFGLSERFEARAAVLSGGEKRKVDIVRALLVDPEVLLLDEACAGLDPSSVDTVWGVFRDHLARSSHRLRSIVFVTHRAEELENADRVGLLESGSLALACTRGELAAAESFDKLKVGYAQESLAAKVVRAVGAPVAAQSPGCLEFLVKNGHLLVPRVFEGLEPGSIRQIELSRENALEKLFRLASAVRADLSSPARRILASGELNPPSGPWRPALQRGCP